MSASITDKLRRGAPAFSTTLGALKATGAASATLSSATGVPTDTAIDFTIGRVDVNGNKTPALKAVYKATLSGSTISNLIPVEGTDQTHAAGTPVEITLTAATWNDMITWGLVGHDQSGVHLPNLPLTTPQIATGIKDVNGNTIIGLTATSSAVNNVAVTDAATGSGPTISAAGSDANIDLNFTPKGTGKLRGVVNNLYNPYKFSAYRNAAANTGNNTPGLITFDTKVFDTGTNYDTSTGRFTAPVDGFYQFSFSSGFTASAGFCVLFLYVNGLEHRRGGEIVSAGGTDTQLSGSCLVKLLATEYAQVYIQSPAANALATGANRNYFTGFLVSAT